MSTPTTNAPVQAQAATPATSEAVVQATQPTAPGEQKAAPTPAEIRKLKLKLEGGEVELPENEVIALAQQGKVAQKRFQEAAQMRREAEEVLSFLKANPKEAFQKLGIDVRKFSEDTLMEILQQETMSPEQRKAKEMEQELRKYRDAEKAAADKKQAEEMQRLESTHLNNYQETFIKALQVAGLPRTTFTVKRMAEHQIVANRKGYTIDPQSLAKLVREDYDLAQKEIYGSADEDTLLNLLGDDGVKKVQKALIKKLKSKPSVQAKSENISQPSPVQKGSWKEFSKKNRTVK